MSLPKTFLGLLEHGSSHGYDLKRSYDEQFGHGRGLGVQVLVEQPLLAVQPALQAPGHPRDRVVRGRARRGVRRRAALVPAVGVRRRPEAPDVHRVATGREHPVDHQSVLSN